MKIRGPLWCQIIHETVMKIVHRHLAVRPRKPVNDNEPVGRA